MKPTRSDPDPATRVYLLRHGESAAPHLFHGAESDIGLSNRGRRQAEAVAGWLAGWQPAGVVSSAMRRAVETATPIAEACGLPLQIEPDLHERRVGTLSGLPIHTHDAIWAATVRRWIAGETAYAPPDAESFDEIQARVLPVWRRLTAEFAGRPLVIVAHGVVCKVLLVSLVQGLRVSDWKRFGPLRNTGISELVQTGETWQAVRLNDLPAPGGQD
jgi:broad specificity phosphatase PhoE